MADEEELEDAFLCFWAGMDDSAMIELGASGSGVGESRMGTGIWAQFDCDLKGLGTFECAGPGIPCIHCEQCKRCFGVGQTA